LIPPAVSPADAQFVLAALSVLGIERAKAAKILPWITRETDTINRIAAVVLSFATSIGVSVSFHAGVLTINGLTYDAALAALVFFGRSLAGQELIYRVVKISSHLSELNSTFAVLASSGEPAEHKDPAPPPVK
jgi:hypothetical protein